MGDIHVGDDVFDENGNPTQVIYETPVHERKCYEVVFQDGASIVVGADHLWLTETHACRKARADLRATAKAKRRRKSTRQYPHVLTTEEIKNTLLVEVGGKLRPNHSIPVCGPVKYPPQNLPVDPYVLGACLGDGTACVGNVPQQYMVGSVEQRLSLLQGLMDTDGTISKRGDCSFYNTNKDLADSVAELASSLGIKVHRETRQPKIDGSDTGRDGGKYSLCHIVHFTTDLPVFRLKRKLARIRPVAIKAKRRYIADVRPAPPAPAKCIAVASPAHLYLTGRTYIVTHNTYGCSIRIVKEAWDNPGTLNWWVAPSYAQSKMAYWLVKRLLPKDFYVEYKADLRIELVEPDGNWHSTMEFKSADNDDNLRGFGVHFFILDEAARISQEAFESVLTTTTQTDGRGIIISTPKGRNWFFDKYQWGEKHLLMPGEHDDHPEWLSIRMPTWTNPHVKPSRIALMRSNMPADVFEQEIAARFLLEGAGVFRGVDACYKLWKGVYQANGYPVWFRPNGGTRYVIGVDLARKKDYTVITVIDVKTKQVVYWDRFNDLSWSVQKSRIVKVAKEYGNSVIYMDGTGVGDPIVEDVRSAGCRVECYIISNRSKQEMIEKLRTSIEFQRVLFPQIPTLIKELRNYEYDVNANGNIKYSAPSGQHDDAVISLALANIGLERAPFKYHVGQVRGV